MQVIFLNNKYSYHSVLGKLLSKDPFFLSDPFLYKKVKMFRNSRAGHQKWVFSLSCLVAFFKVKLCLLPLVLIYHLALDHSLSTELLFKWIVPFQYLQTEIGPNSSQFMGSKLHAWPLKVNTVFPLIRIIFPLPIRWH